MTDAFLQELGQDWRREVPPVAIRRLRRQRLLSNLSFAAELAGAAVSVLVGAWLLWRGLPVYSTLGRLGGAVLVTAPPVLAAASWLIRRGQPALEDGEVGRRRLRCAGRDIVIDRGDDVERRDIDLAAEIGVADRDRRSLPGDVHAHQPVQVVVGLQGVVDEVELDVQAGVAAPRHRNLDLRALDGVVEAPHEHLVEHRPLVPVGVPGTIEGEVGYAFTRRRGERRRRDRF